MNLVRISQALASVHKHCVGYLYLAWGRCQVPDFDNRDSGRDGADIQPKMRPQGLIFVSICGQR